MGWVKMNGPLGLVDTREVSKVCAYHNFLESLIIHLISPHPPRNPSATRLMSGFEQNPLFTYSALSRAVHT